MQHRAKREYIGSSGHIPISGITDDSRCRVQQGYQTQAGKRDEYWHHWGIVATHMEKPQYKNNY